MVITEVISPSEEVCLVWRLALCSATLSLFRDWGEKTSVLRVALLAFSCPFTIDCKCVKAFSEIISFGP